MKRFSDYKKDIDNFFRESGYNVDPVPSVHFDTTEVNQFDPFISTGNYDEENNVINIYISKRHLKDILRTYCHELAHCVQWHNDQSRFKESKGDSIIDNDKTKDLESEAYTIGNIMFRSWTEKMQENK